MAADIEKWFCSELVKFGIPATEDNARYILSMEDDNDLEEYMNGLLDTSDPKVRVFLQELRVRCGKGSQSNSNVMIYRKEGAEITPPKNSKKKKTRETVNTNESGKSTLQPLSNGSLHELTTALPDTQTSLQTKQSLNPVETGEIGVGAKKKTKFIPLYSKEGQEKSVIQLPGRHTCECQAAKHKLINNCMNCGRVVCEQEGAGPCVFCGNLVCTPEDQEIIDRGSKKGEKLRQYLMKGGAQNTPKLDDSSSHSLLSHSSSQSKQGFEKALQHKNKLLEYDRTSVRRTQVIDDECDYYATDSNQWLSQEDRTKLSKREEELRQARHGSRRDRKITFDFAGRRVIDDEDTSGLKMYSKDDEIIQEVHYGKSKTGNSSSEIINPTIQFNPPKFDESVSWGPSHRQQDTTSPGNFNPAKSTTSRIQDRELQEMSDEGMCLSMHQPWASLLVEGIKMHEGRTWYTPHRGRLWIASTAKTPTTEEIRELEDMYRHICKDPSLTFPKDYPTGCLLGCVNVDDCLSQEEYRVQYPDGESASPYVFICSNPQQLIVKFPIKGKHKIYKLDQHIHQAAKKGLR